MYTIKLSLERVTKFSLVVFITGFISSCGGGSSSSETTVDKATTDSAGEDPLYADQWHLNNTAQFSGAWIGEDINVVPVWNAGVKGQGVLVAVVDDGLQLAHEDIAANIAANKSWDFRQGDTDPSPQSHNSHGTSVAGLIAARDLNGLGLRGVAPRASLAAFNLLWDSDSGTVSTFDLFDAMTLNSSDVAVSNNSWGSVDNLGEAEPPTDNLWHQGIASGIANGRNGKGTIYVWAAGNGTEHFSSDLIGQDNSNYDFQANNRHVIAVCAVDGRGKRASYSEPGANIWLCAPGGPAGSTGLTTTDLMGAAGVNDQYRNPSVTDEYADKAYTKNFLGTSASTPIVSGVVALMLEANPDLGWRDVRLILAETARMNDPNHSGWSLTSPANGQPQYNINHNYGFGVVEAQAAVVRSQTWNNVGNQVIIEKKLSNSVVVPDNDSTEIQQTITLDAVNFPELIIEYVEVDFSSDHQYYGDLEITLTAPSGTQSILAETHDCLIEFFDPLTQKFTYHKRQGACVYKYNPWTFATARHLGETSTGTWVLNVADNGNTGAVGKLLSWTLRIYGRAL